MWKATLSLFLVVCLSVADVTTVPIKRSHSKEKILYWTKKVNYRRCFFRGLLRCFLHFGIVDELGPCVSFPATGHFTI